MSCIHHAALPSIFVFAMQLTPQTTTEPPVIPADQSAEIYALYSALVDHPEAGLANRTRPRSTCSTIRPASNPILRPAVA